MVRECFLIDCRTQESRSIFKFNVAGRVQEYFQIQCRMQGSSSIFKLNIPRGGHVARGGHGVFSN